MDHSLRVGLGGGQLLLLIFLPPFALDMVSELLSLLFAG